MKSSYKRFWSLASSVVVLGVLILFQPAVFADGNHSGGDNAASPIKVGYAVITPTSTATAGLVVFETFGEHQGNNVLQTGVLPSTMTTHAGLFANANGRLSRNLGVAIANPSAVAAHIQLTLYDQAGATIVTSPLVLDALKQSAFFVTQLFEKKASVPRDFTGTLDVKSDIPVAVMGLRARGSNFTALPATAIAPVDAVPQISANIGGPGAVILAQFAAGGGWASEIIIANFGPDPLTVRVDLFASDGTPLTTTFNGATGSSFQNIVIPSQGVATLAALDKGGDSDF
jgi:hypothetical protein